MIAFPRNSVFTRTSLIFTLYVHTSSCSLLEKERGKMVPLVMGTDEWKLWSNSLVTSQPVLKVLLNGLISIAHCSHKASHFIRFKESIKTPPL